MLPFPNLYSWSPNLKNAFSFQDNECLFHVLVDMKLSHAVGFYLSVPQGEMTGTGCFIEKPGMS